MKIDISSLSSSSSPLMGNVSGVYVLFHNDDVVYVGQGWNCFLRVAEHTRKDSDKIFTHWNFVEISSELERKLFERELINEYRPKYNRTFMK